MATIDSLDLASLQNNPQSIAEALEDALETTDGTIGQLKTDAQSKKDDIDDLYDQALIVKNNIDSLFSSSNSVEEYYTTTLDNSFVAWDLTTQPTDEHGLRIQRFGKIYIMQIAMYRSGTSTTSYQQHDIKTLSSSDITLPSNDVNLGLGSKGSSGERDNISRLEFKSNGTITMTYYNEVSSVMHVLGNFIGVDV